MIQSIPGSRNSRPAIGAPTLLLLLLLATLLWLYHQAPADPGPLVLHSGQTATDFDYAVITTDLTVDWSGGGDFDPRNRCPDDFFAAGFVLLIRKAADGGYFRFFYHRGK